MSSESLPPEKDSIETQMLEAFGTPSEISAALEHVQEMRRSGQFCCIQLGSDYDYVWDVKFSWSEQIPHINGHKQHLGTEVPSESLSEAIEEFYARWKAGELPTE